MPNHTTTVGNVELLALNDGGPVRSPLIPFPDTTIEQWREFPELLDEHDQVRSRYGTTGVRSQGKLIIVDTGLQAPDGTLMTDMRAKGVDPEVRRPGGSHPPASRPRGLEPHRRQAELPQRPLPGAEKGLGLLDPARRAGWSHPRARPGGAPGGSGFHRPDRRRPPDYRRAHHGFHAGAYPGPRLDNDRLRRRAGLHPGRRGAQPGPGRTTPTGAPSSTSSPTYPGAPGIRCWTCWRTSRFWSPQDTFPTRASAISYGSRDGDPGGESSPVDKCRHSGERTSPRT